MDYRLMKIKYMSGTENSYRAASWMIESAREKGISAEIAQISTYCRRTAATNKEGTLLGFVFPTYGFTAPWTVIRHALQQPFGKGRHAFVVATKGALMIDSVPIRGFEGSAAYMIALLLMIKGHRIRGVMGLDMPANMINVHSGLTEEDSRIIISQARDGSCVAPIVIHISGIRPLFSGKAVLSLRELHWLRTLRQKLSQKCNQNDWLEKAATILEINL